MELNLSTSLPMFVYTFQAMWRHRPVEEYLVIVGIRAAHTSFSLFTLVYTSHSLIIPYRIISVRLWQTSNY